MNLKIYLSRSPVELYKILKFESLVNSGAQAKIAIENGEVKLNDQVVFQKRKKINYGDQIEFMAVKYTCVPLSK